MRRCLVTSDTVIEVRRLTKRFGRRTALENVDFELARGRIMALVGPNGSGKTTLLKLLAGFLKPSDGTARVFGLDPRCRRPEVMQHARFAFAPPALYDNLTAREILDALASLSIARSQPLEPPSIDQVLDIVGLTDRADDRLRVFSFGMRQRLALAQAMLPMPRLLVLDEPTDGLDPLAILELRGVLQRIRREHGVTILLSSHLLVEVDKLVDELLLLDEGRMLYRGSPGELRQKGRRLCLVVEGDGDASSRAADLLRRAGLTPELRDDLGLLLPCGAITLGDAAELLSGGGVSLREFREETPSLEEALLARLRAVSRRGDNH